MDENEEENDAASEEDHESEHEEETDSAISELLAQLESAHQRIAELENRLQQCESRIDGHESGFKHEPAPASAESPELEPEPAHWYFKRVGGRG